MKFLHRNSMKILVSMILVIAFTSLEIMAAPSVATISKYSGSVYVKKSGGEKKMSAFKGMRLLKGDTIFTTKNSSVTLDVDEDKELTLGSNTQLSITELSKELDSSSKSEFRLWTGKAWANITKKLDKNSRYEIRTSTTIAGVRGTKFYVSQDEDTTEIVVLEGTVIAETFVMSEKPDGTYAFEKVEKSVEKNEQFTVQDSTQSGSEISLKAVELKTLDLFVLTSFRESIAESNPELLEELDKIIDIKEEEVKNNPVEEYEEEKIIPQISYDPVITTSIPPNNNDIVTSPQPDPSPGSDNTPPIGKLFDIYALSETQVLFVQFSEALNPQTLSITNPADLLKNSSIGYTTSDGVLPVHVKEVQWTYSGNMTNTPLLEIILESPTGFMDGNQVIVNFKTDIIKDLSGNTNNSSVIGNCIDRSSGLLPTILGTDYLNEIQIRNSTSGNTFTITLGNNQGDWVNDIISDTNKLNMLYESFYVDSGLDGWNKIKANLSAQLVDSKTISITIPQTSDYNITKDQWVSLLIPEELVTLGNSCLTMPFIISADFAAELPATGVYSIPEKGSSPGTTKITSLDTVSISGATKWQIKVMDEWYYDPIYYDSIINGAVDYFAGSDINVLPDQYIILLAVDDSGKIKSYANIFLNSWMISLVSPPVENLRFINTTTGAKKVLISNWNLPKYEWLEVITTNATTPPDPDTATAEYWLNTSASTFNQIGIQDLEVLTGTPNTEIGDTVYYRFVDGADKTSWIPDGTISDANPLVNTNGAAPGNFILSSKDGKAVINGVSGMSVAIIKNDIISAPIYMSSSDSIDVYIEGGITPYDDVVLVILNEDGNICSKSDDFIKVPQAMNNDANYNGFGVQGHLNSIKISNTYGYFNGYSVNVYKNGSLVTTSGSITIGENMIPISGGLIAGDTIQLQVIDTNGNESALSEEVIVMETPNSSDVTLHYGASAENDTITISNLKPNEYYTVNMLPISGNNPNYDYLGGTTDTAGTLGPINFEISVTSQTTGTTGSTCEIYLSDGAGNTGLKSELITAE